MSSVLTDTSDGTSFPAWVGATWTRATVLRYGENPHQKAALYTHGRPGVATAERLHGKEMSYNNFVDADAAQRAAYDHAEPAVAIIKHANPCGIAVGADIAQAHSRAHACDPQSAYGGVVATNRPVTAAMAEQVAEVFTEVVVAPDYEPEALKILQRKKAIRLLRLPAAIERPADIELRAVSGGILIQTRDKVDAVVEGDGSGGDDPSLWTLVSGQPADAADDGRPGVRLAAPSGLSSPTPSCWPGTAPASASAWARSTGLTPATWRSPAPAQTARPAQWRPRMRSSRSPTD
jgi:phosphoribosylaminoimidazolecarboxamide formyltransferase/IMP cyclohydrolase